MSDSLLEIQQRRRNVLESILRPDRRGGAASELSSRRSQDIDAIPSSLSREPSGLPNPENRAGKSASATNMDKASTEFASSPPSSPPGSASAADIPSTGNLLTVTMTDSGTPVLRSARRSMSFSEEGSAPAITVSEVSIAVEGGVSPPGSVTEHPAPTAAAASGTSDLLLSPPASGSLRRRSSGGNRPRSSSDASRQSQSVRLAFVRVRVCFHVVVHRNSLTVNETAGYVD
jgi:hypothetical protein